MDRSLPGSSIHGIFQERVLEWGAIAFSELEHYIAPIKHVAFKLEETSFHSLQSVAGQER